MKTILGALIIFISSSAFAAEDSKMQEYIYQLKVSGVVLICEDGYSANEINKTIRKIGEKVPVKAEHFSRDHSSMSTAYRFCVLLNKK